MPSIDVRSRTIPGEFAIEPASFFATELPALLASNASLAVPGATALGVEPLSIVAPTGAWTLALEGNAITVTPGDHGAAVLRLDDDELARLIDDRITPMTLLMAGTLRVERGDLGDVLDWWVVLRAVLDERPAYTPGAVTFRDRDGAELDLSRVFGPEDDDADLAHFVAEAGFLHLAGWFPTEVMDEIDRDIDEALPRYEPDDGKSWWARTSSEHRAVRLQGFQRWSEATRELLASERFARIGAILDDGHESAGSVEALIKPIGVVEGISDVPWHKDCSPGMHSYRCSGLVVGVSITASDATSGQLAVVPGSHRALIQPAFYRSDWGLPTRTLPTAKGDVTVHCTCTMHMSHPPVDRERRVLYTAFGLPKRHEASEDERALWAVRAQVHRKVSQKPSPVAAQGTR